MHDRPGGRFHDDRRFPHLAARQTLNLIPQFIARNGEQGPVVLLHFRRPSLRAGENFFGGRQRLVQRQNDRFLTGDHGHGLGRVPGPLRLHRKGDLGELC
jgi:hypothetical protein